MRRPASMSDITGLITRTGSVSSETSDTGAVQDPDNGLDRAPVQAQGRREAPGIDRAPGAGLGLPVKDRDLSMDQVLPAPAQDRRTVRALVPANLGWARGPVRALAA